jgi:hypothetical protein
MKQRRTNKSCEKNSKTYEKNSISIGTRKGENNNHGKMNK